MKKLKAWLKSRKFWKRLIISALVVPILLFALVLIIVHVKQDEIVEELMVSLNEDFVGATEISDSHISLFENFPYISIDLEDFRVYESKDKSTKPLIDINDVYAGFNLWTVLTGKMEIKKIKLTEGHIDIIQHEDGELNILKALSSKEQIEDAGEEFHLDLKKIELKEIDITKFNETNGVKIEAYINKAKSKFKTSDERVHASLDSKFLLNIIKNGDTTFFKHKHIGIDTEVDFYKIEEKLKLQPTTVKLEEAEFNMGGEIDFKNNMFLDLEFSGQKSNFDLLIALAPEDLIPTLKSYENSAELLIETTIKGASINGHNPAVNATFNCDNGTIRNLNTQKSIKNLTFSGYYTNGDQRNMETMKCELTSFSAQSGEGVGSISGNLDMKNFKAPELLTNWKANFDLKFISDFIEIEDISDVNGKLSLNFGFHDIIDLQNPEHAISKLNENYELSLIIEDGGLKYDQFPLPIHDLELDVEMHGHEAAIEKLNLIVGASDVQISGLIEDLPALIHHSDIPVDTKLKFASNKIDLFELTGKNKDAINEEISNLEMKLDFKASAQSFTESEYLPKGEFFIEDFHADLKNYPHKLHDFHADIIVGERDLEIIDFKGMIDKSDFLFTGKLEHYEKWLDEHPGGDSKIEFNLASKMLQLESLFAYKGENYVPEDYRHEEFDDLKIHGFTYLHFNEELQSMDLNIDKFHAKMKVHPLKFENFSGRVHYEDEHLVVEDFHGKLGHSVFKTTLHYYLGEDEKIKKRDNHFEITASRLDVDQLIAYNPAPIIKSDEKNTVDHDAGFNIYTLPFTDMTYHIDIGELNYHHYDLRKVKGQLRTNAEHYLYVEQLDFGLSGGHFDITGYFNGSNPELIYFSPVIKATNVDLDELMFKFENFGQDYLVSENLHGKFTGKITGKIHMHNDLVPKLDDSEIHMDLDVTNGRLENYTLLEYMSDYFKDKNLNKVLFDTLNNHIDIENGVMIIPKMVINSSIGHMEISGEQQLDGNMEYYLRIPWKMVTQTASSKLFKKKSDEGKSEDDIEYGDENTRYVNIKITSDEDGYNFSLGKPKKK